MNYYPSIYNLVDPNDPMGRTYKEVNAAKVHNIPIGALVEDIDTGIRAFVVSLNRDCDKTPLYSLCLDKDDTIVETVGFGNRRWHMGYPEDALRIIKLPSAMKKKK